MKTKVCRDCGKTKELCEFSPHPVCTLGVRPDCKVCYNLSRKDYYKKNRKMLLKRHKINRDKHKESLKTQRKIRYEKNKEKTKQKRKQDYIKYRDRILKQKQIYYIENKTEISQKKKQYKKQKLKTNTSFRLEHNLRRRLSLALNGSLKSLNTMSLVGCSIDYLMHYIQEQFTKGMSWDNYGFYGWHIDHIRPCASFDLSKEQSQKECFHYSNLQPLWAEENLSKGSKIIDNIKKNDLQSKDLTN